MRCSNLNGFCSKGGQRRRACRSPRRARGCAALRRRAGPRLAGLEQHDTLAGGRGLGVARDHAAGMRRSPRGSGRTPHWPARSASGGSASCRRSRVRGPAGRRRRSPRIGQVEMDAVEHRPAMCPRRQQHQAERGQSAAAGRASSRARRSLVRSEVPRTSAASRGLAAGDLGRGQHPARRLDHAPHGEFRRRAERIEQVDRQRTRSAPRPWAAAPRRSAM